MADKSLQRAAKTLLAYLDANSGSNPAYHDAAIYIRILQAESERLRQIISDSATACGAAMSPECTVEFMGHLPAEIAGVLRPLRAELERARAEGERYRWLRDRMAVEDIPGEHPAWSRPSEFESAKVDAAVDAAMGKGGKAGD